MLTKIDKSLTNIPAYYKIFSGVAWARQGIPIGGSKPPPYHGLDSSRCGMNCNNEGDNNEK